MDAERERNNALKVENLTGVPVSRRSFMASVAGGVVLAGASTLGLTGCSSAPVGTEIGLPPLPYGETDLEPWISRKTIEFHYGKHHKAYADKTKELLKDYSSQPPSLEEIIKQTAGLPEKAVLFNNAAQTWNHDFYWKSLKPNGGGMPDDRLSRMIDASFGNLGNLKQALLDAALSQFGSGWVWLVLDGDKLKATKTPNAANPLIQRQIPLLTIDVWEHAYYLDYQNRRADYVKALMDHLLNWDFAESNLPKG